jgi:hypothetical protein
MLGMPGSSEMEGRRWRLGAPWAAMSVSMAAPLWSVRARGRSDYGQHGVHINARRSRARVQEGRGASKAWLPRARPRVALCGNSTNTWRASVRTKWGAKLGHFQAESVFGPKSKVVHLSMLYNFYLGVIVIGDLI